nr:DUF397 domain-containing protein [Streptomyces specialis]
MALITPDTAWFKSSYSSENATACVEVAAFRHAGRVGIRDSKDTTRPALAVPGGQFAAFITLSPILLIYAPPRQEHISAPTRHLANSFCLQGEEGIRDFCLARGRGVVCKSPSPPPGTGLGISASAPSALAVKLCP